jgi:hypothetical protein
LIKVGGEVVPGAHPIDGQVEVGAWEFLVGVQPRETGLAGAVPGASISVTF